jgi:hypothetical protein
MTQPDSEMSPRMSLKGLGVMENPRLTEKSMDEVNMMVKN